MASTWLRIDELPVELRSDLPGGAAETVLLGLPPEADWLIRLKAARRLGVLRSTTLYVPPGIYNIIGRQSLDKQDSLIAIPAGCVIVMDRGAQFRLRRYPAECNTPKGPKPCAHPTLRVYGTIDARHHHIFDTRRITYASLTVHDDKGESIASPLDFAAEMRSEGIVDMIRGNESILAAWFGARGDGTGAAHGFTTFGHELTEIEPAFLAEESARDFTVDSLAIADAIYAALPGQVVELAGGADYVCGRIPLRWPTNNDLGHGGGVTIRGNGATLRRAPLRRLARGPVPRQATAEQDLAALLFVTNRLRKAFYDHRLQLVPIPRAKRARDTQGVHGMELGEAVFDTESVVTAGHAYDVPSLAVLLVELVRAFNRHVALPLHLRGRDLPSPERVPEPLISAVEASAGTPGELAATRDLVNALKMQLEAHLSAPIHSGPGRIDHFTVLGAHLRGARLFDTRGFDGTREIAPITLHDLRLVGIRDTLIEERYLYFGEEQAALVFVGGSNIRGPRRLWNCSFDVGERRLGTQYLAVVWSPADLEVVQCTFSLRAQVDEQTPLGLSEPRPAILWIDWDRAPGSARFVGTTFGIPDLPQHGRTYAGVAAWHGVADSKLLLSGCHVGLVRPAAGFVRVPAELGRALDVQGGSVRVEDSLLHANVGVRATSARVELVDCQLDVRRYASVGAGRLFHSGILLPASSATADIRSTPVLGQRQIVDDGTAPALLPGDLLRPPAVPAEGLFEVLITSRSPPAALPNRVLAPGVEP